MRVSILALVVLSCGRPAPIPDEPDPGDARRYLTPTETLVRASLALRGIRPSLAELERVEATPEAFEQVVDDYLESPEFGETVRHFHDAWLLADTDNNYYPMGFPAVGALADVDAWVINESVSEAPARLAEHIVVGDRPYTELVTADYTLADPIVATVWGLPYDDEGGWQVTSYEDGRPHAGVLVDPWLHVRHASTPTNRQRARAAHLARALLCHDYMKREVRVPEDADLTAGGRNAIEDNAVCVACHQTLDPLGAAFAPYRGVVVPEAVRAYPIETYRPSRADDYVAPRFYGEPADDLYDLGQQIADDPRFWRCSIRRFAGQLLGRPAEAVPDHVVDRHVPAFVDSGFRVEPILKSIVLSPTFAEASGDPDSPALVDGLRRATPWMLARSIEDLTGHRWETWLPNLFGFGRIGRVPLMEDVSFGFKTLAGGPDGYDEWEPLVTANPTTLLALRGLAAQSAPAVVSRELARPEEERILLRGVDDPTGAIVALHFRLFGQRRDVDDPEVTALVRLWEVAGGPTDPEAGWTAVIYAVLQNPRMLYY
ncbi:MAG: DUF1549 domain-containing protein [Myxococcota bacterium]